jgi:hypothetical protein
MSGTSGYSADTRLLNSFLIVGTCFSLFVAIVFALVESLLLRKACYLERMLAALYYSVQRTTLKHGYREPFLASILSPHPAPAENAQELNAHNLVVLKSSHRQSNLLAWKQEFVVNAFSRQSAAECFHCIVLAKSCSCVFRETYATMLAHPMSRQCFSIRLDSATFSPISVHAGDVRDRRAASAFTATTLAPVAVEPMLTI